jgi:hypothetical protein
MPHYQQEESISSVVRLTTRGTPPISYTQPVDAMNFADSPAGRTGAAGVSLADDLNASHRLLAVELQLRLERAPTAIQHGFRHPGLGRLTHVPFLMRPFMSPQSPDRACHRVGQRYDRHVLRSALGEIREPLGRFFAVREHRASPVDQ